MQAPWGRQNYQFSAAPTGLKIILLSSAVGELAAGAALHPRWYLSRLKALFHPAIMVARWKRLRRLTVLFTYHHGEHRGG